jgi:hypothetical protein
LNYYTILLYMAKRKSIKYKSIAFKFTSSQKKRVDAYCRKNKVTPIRLYKKAIMLYLNNNGYGENYIFSEEPHKNQMSIFDLMAEEAHKV